MQIDPASCAYGSYCDLASKAQLFALLSTEYYQIVSIFTLIFSNHSPTARQLHLLSPYSSGGWDFQQL